MEDEFLCKIYYASKIFYARKKFYISQILRTYLKFWNSVNFKFSKKQCTFVTFVVSDVQLRSYVSL